MSADLPVEGTSGTQVTLCCTRSTESREKSKNAGPVFTVAVAPALAPCVAMYPPGAPGIGQQMFYGQAQPVMIPR
ncbi:unnamed protein product [Cuscuta campestris]|uniref:Uncharacterized protein n=1 Tax=Cuscuta campestris TaxID=132261 RepID=A0A484MCD3_9ASTE|nr:unnamed protein product [Cuscuta campestris]